MVMILVYAFVATMFCFFMCLLRAFWHYVNLLMYERIWTELITDQWKLDQQIALELVKCAARNPEAAVILKERIGGWCDLPSSPGHQEYRRLFGDETQQEPPCESPTA